jgi:N,N'-diacetyllegionaminate synthase
MAIIKKKFSLYIIAEIGSAHDGSFGNACNMIVEAKKCGADAVKFQIHIPEEETLRTAASPPYFNNENRFDYFKRTSFTVEQLYKLKKLCENNNVDFLSSPFSIKAVEILERLKVKAYKIPSGEVTNLPLLQTIKKTKKKVFLSTGMSSWSEIDSAQKIFPNKDKLTIMQCTSLYPCPIDKVGLNVLDLIKKRYKTKIGFSDHTIGSVAAIGSVFFGAEVIEKHFTLSKKMYGSDAKNSMEPNDFLNFCNDLRSALILKQSIIDKKHYSYLLGMKKLFEKSIVAASDIKKGTAIDLSHINFKKPGNGISASEYLSLIGKVLKKNLKKDEKINYSDFIKR